VKFEFVRSMESGGRFGVGALDMNVDSIAVKMFSHLSYFTITFCFKFFTFITICEDYAAINCVTVQYIKV
jgi:hypothetical protein